MDLADYKPSGKLDKNHLLSLMDYSAQDIYEILHLAKKLKWMQKSGKKHLYLKNKTVALIFSKSSTRTRISFEQGIRQMGGNPMFLSSQDIQLGRGETIHDTAKVLARYGIDGIMIRTFKQSDVEDLAKFGGMPVINGLTDDFHPCQALADMLTIHEAFGKLKGIKLSYFGDGNNVTNSLMLAGAKLGLEVCVCTPKSNRPDMRIVEEASKFGKIVLTDSVSEAATNCDVLYTDVFFSMGQAQDKEKYDRLMPFQINADVMKKAKQQAIFLHCLPAHRGEEVTEDVIDGSHSLVFEQAENRLHAQKAVMALLMGKK